MSDIPIARLRQLAEDPHYKKNAYWHRRLGKVLRDASYVHEAIDEYNISVKLDDQDWGALEGMAFCYEKLEQYLPAIEWEYKTLDKLPEQDKDEKPSILQTISGWRLKLNDIEGAIKTSDEAWSLLPEDTSILATYLDALDVGSKYKEIMEIAARLGATNLGDGEENMLSRLFLDFDGTSHDIIGNAAREVAQPEYIVHAMEDAIVAAERRNNAELVATQRRELADFLHRHMFKTDRAMEVLEEALNSSLTRKSTYDVCSQRRFIVQRLSQIYYDNAIAGESHREPFDHWISKIKNLAKSCMAADGKDILSTKEALIMLGLWYRKHGNLDGAKFCLGPRILEGIDMLTDDDPENDVWAYSTLAETLLKAGDRENAGAAFAVTVAPLDKLKAIRQEKQNAPAHSVAMNNTSMKDLTPAVPIEESVGSMALADSTAPGTDTNPLIVSPTARPPNFFWSCDGLCKRKVEDWSAIFFCEVCMNGACFCDVCIELVKGQRLRFKRCSASHSFYQGYPVEKKTENIAAVEVDGKILPRKEWLEGLRREWDD